MAVNLTTLINSEPTNAAKSDAEVLTWLREGVVVPKDVPWLDLLLWLSDTDGLRKLKDAEEKTQNSAAIRNAAGLLLVVAQAGQPLSLSLTAVRQALVPLIGPVFTTAQKDALLALSDKTVERWTLSAPLELNGRSLPDGPGIAHVIEARS